MCRHYVKFTMKFSFYIVSNSFFSSIDYSFLLGDLKVARTHLYKFFTMTKL